MSKHPTNDAPHKLHHNKDGLDRTICLAEFMPLKSRIKVLNGNPHQTPIISIGQGKHLDRGFIGQDEGPAGAGAATARLAIVRKRLSEELSMTQGDQLMIESNYDDFYTPRNYSWNPWKN